MFRVLLELSKSKEQDHFHIISCKVSALGKVWCLGWTNPDIGLHILRLSAKQVSTGYIKIHQDISWEFLCKCMLAGIFIYLLYHIL